MKLTAVIGANYGDEGKGSVTHALSDSSTLVVRFNGGAQAGHTVVGPQGERHVFHHFGSGTLNGASTYLSRYFILNPLLFRSEYEVLQKKNVGFGRVVSVFAAPDCRVTTPWDMMLNQASEVKKGTLRHGSCGVGINETVTRELKGPKLSFKDLASTRRLCPVLRTIVKEWVPKRAEELGLSKEELGPWLDTMTKWLGIFIEDCSFLYNHCSMMPIKSIKVFGKFTHKHVLFEGAQGLKLDEDDEGFPYVTRSKTGTHNVLALLDELGVRYLLGDLRVLYVTRPYLTRHGAGPLPFELPGAPYPGIQDPTNVPNPHQGTIRYAWLDVDALATRIKKDLGAESRIRAGIALTCGDQMPELFSVVSGGKIVDTTMDSLAREIVDKACLKEFQFFYPQSEVCHAMVFKGHSMHLHS